MLHGLAKDPRTYQIATLLSLLIFGVFARAFEVSPLQIGALVLTACAVQWLGGVLVAARADFKSPLITALSLSLLLRADALWPLMAAAAIAIGSKFMFRANGKHLFNPANIGIVAVIALTDAAWTTPGQWGTAVWFAALLAGAGLFVAYRAARIDVPLIFLGVFAALLFARTVWLGDPLSIPLLRLQNGALILFAFFMISDPKTTPDGRASRAVFAGGTALLAYLGTFHLHQADGLFYALAAMCLIRPLLERLDPAPRYAWGDPVKPLTAPRPWRNAPSDKSYPAPAE